MINFEIRDEFKGLLFWYQDGKWQYSQNKMREAGEVWEVIREEVIRKEVKNVGNH